MYLRIGFMVARRRYGCVWAACDYQLFFIRLFWAWKTLEKALIIHVNSLSQLPNLCQLGVHFHSFARNPAIESSSNDKTLNAARIHIRWNMWTNFGRTSHVTFLFSSFGRSFSLLLSLTHSPSQSILCGRTFEKNYCDPYDKMFRHSKYNKKTSNNFGMLASLKS